MDSEFCANTSVQLRKLTEKDEEIIPDNYWPCAPDGYIPNSVVRSRVPPRQLPQHLMPRLVRGVTRKKWMKLLTKKRQQKKICKYRTVTDHNGGPMGDA